MMKPVDDEALKIHTITDLMHRLKLPAPQHPLITLVNYDQIKIDLSDAGSWMVLDFYKITFKRRFNGSVRYGPGTYDFKEGGMAFLAPGQLVQKTGNPQDYQGYALYFHPYLLQHHPLAQKIHRYGFFAYDVAEALYLSDKEKQTMATLFESINAELANHIDQFSEDVLVSQLDLLLNHSNRFYNRQFLTRKTLHHDLIDRLNVYLTSRSDKHEGLTSGLPSPPELAEHLGLSQRYLSDMLKSLTGKTTQQYIHLHLIEQAKTLLNATNLTTAEIAYQLGFEHPQSFNRFFRQKTRQSPAGFKHGITETDN